MSKSILLVLAILVASSEEGGLMEKSGRGREEAKAFLKEAFRREMWRDAVEYFEDWDTAERSDPVLSSMMINAMARAGQPLLARHFFDRMLLHGSPANAVACSSMLKSYCRAGELQAAERFLQQLEPRLLAKPRVVNMYVRGCVQHGASNISCAVEQTMVKLARKDTTTRKLLVQLYCQVTCVGVRERV
eukprot:749047-Hanusia_phi.AAC.3